MTYLTGKYFCNSLTLLDPNFVLHEDRVKCYNYYKTGRKSQLIITLSRLWNTLGMIERVVWLLFCQASSTHMNMPVKVGQLLDTLPYHQVSPSPSRVSGAGVRKMQAIAMNAMITMKMMAKKRSSTLAISVHSLCFPSSVEPASLTHRIFLIIPPNIYNGQYIVRTYNVNIPFSVKSKPL